MTVSLLFELAAAARARPPAPLPPAQARAPSLRKALEARPGIVAEIKRASPTEGVMREGDVAPLARALADAGAAGLSVLTEPTRFGGDAAHLGDARGAGAPLLMKDFVVTARQLDAAQGWGASAVLLILPLLTREHSEWATPEDAIAAAHERGLEVLLEVYDDEDYLLAGLLDADMVGVNNRDLREPDLPVDPERTIGVLSRYGTLDVPVLALSGAKTAGDVREQVKAGARGVLVGTTLMRAQDPAAKLKELLEGTH